MRAFSDVQAAVYRALVAEPTVSAIVGARVFDDVPHEAEPLASSFPRVTIGDQSGEERCVDDADLFEVSVTLHAWSRLPGRKECLDLMAAIVTALHRKSHYVSAGVLLALNYEGHETAKEADGETYHGTIRFNGLMQFG